MLRTKTLITLFACLLTLQACKHQMTEEQHSAEAFLQTLVSLCGETFVGEMTYPLDGQDSFAGKTLIASFETCDSEQVRVPFSVGEDRSRTWVFTKTESSVQLKHDHRHKDGSPDDISNYGGDAVPSLDSFSQSFAADVYTQTLIPEASTNVWTVSLSEDLQQLTYHLERHTQPRFTAVLMRAK